MLRFCFYYPTHMWLAYPNTHARPGFFPNTNTRGIHTMGKRVARLKVDVEVYLCPNPNLLHIARANATK